MNSFINELFEYNFQVNQKLTDQIMENQGSIPEKALQLFCHVLNAHRIWNNRIEPKQTGFSGWEIHDILELHTINNTNYEASLQILNTFDVLQNIPYTNMQGRHLNSPVRDILFHIINHSTYHRGQIAALFRENGIEPLSTDYIIFKR